MKVQFFSNGSGAPILKTNQTVNRKSIIRTSGSAQDLRGQSVAVIGLGKSGRAAVRLALARGASVVAIDQNKNLGLLEEDPLFERHNGGLRTILGHFHGELLHSVDRVVVSPGVPQEKYGLSSLGHGKQVMSELDFAAEILPKSTKILAVTGTNGKSTVVTFAGQVAVVEVSSYQMEIANKYFCPSVAVVLNLTPDHLDRHGTMRNYAMTKCRIFSHMTDAKLAILPLGNQHLNEAICQYMNEVNRAWIGTFPGVEIDMETKIARLEVPSLEIVSQLKLHAMKVMGTHNYHNAAVAALSVAGLGVGFDVESLGSTIGNLRVPFHRMQIGKEKCRKFYALCKDSNGVTWVDDSKATNVDATYTGLMGLKGKKSLILLGGIAKDLDGEGSNGFERLVEPLNYHRCVITFGSSGTVIQRTLSEHGLQIPCIKATNMAEAVSHARRMAKHGDAIVLSPACASFDEFRNFEHRGMVFQELAFS